MKNSFGIIYKLFLEALNLIRGTQNVNYYTVSNLVYFYKYANLGKKYYIRNTGPLKIM